MGDRSQVCIKQGSSKVYLYGHWIGSDIYKAVGRALVKAPDRHTDAEYLARVVFQEMLGKDTSTIGFGIGVSEHGDTEHPIPVLDCDTQRVSLAPSDSRFETSPAQLSFADFAQRALAGQFDAL